MTNVLRECTGYDLGERCPIPGEPARLAGTGNDGRHRRVRQRELQTGGLHAQTVTIRDGLDPSNLVEDRGRRACSRQPDRLSTGILVARNLPTVHMQDFASHELGVLQVENGLHHVGDGAHSVKRVISAELGTRLGWMHRRLHDPG